MIAEIPAEAAGLAAEVIVVVDGARDATAAEGAEAGALVCDVPVNRGQGAALRLGYWLARARGAQVIVTIDADGQYEADEIARVMEPILQASRLRLGLAPAGYRADHRRHPPRRGDRVRRADQLARPPPDHRPGLRAARHALRGDRGGVLEQPQYQASELMISAALNGFRLAEVPTTMRDRGHHATGTKKGGNLGYGVRFARAAVHTWWRDRTAARRRAAAANTQCS